MKIIVCLLFIGAVFSAKTAHTYTKGLAPVWSKWIDPLGPPSTPAYQKLNYRGEGDLQVNILSTTSHLATYTEWCDNANCGWESSFDSFYEGENMNLYLQFEIPSVPSTNFDGDLTTQKERCLVCMNVDENSELRDGDTGFAVCYKTKTGNFFTYSAAAPFALNTADPKFTFMGTVKAVNKGNAVKATKKNGWLSSF